jgi:hypothetical protein
MYQRVFETEIVNYELKEHQIEQTETTQASLAIDPICQRMFRTLQ